ncbi:DUF1761 domain-containing protein [Chryseobacterium sp. KBW03]|uniref:DUF1761 domain-containing protein n=1 Tax=Chryseobacterium sp. KBW03 TaxID=2153362 RepID=UPI000F5B2088|nr:DUF1761 domain-containing protein [Chryseobacterium sp. KBW03]RQO39376.1 DUF1761 domain-containing protein [Chryseobacterium sp. KBW03]
MIKYILKINWLAVLLSLVFYSFFGWLWFTVLFPNQYASTLDKLGLLPVEPDPIYFYGPPLTILPTIITTALLMRVLDIKTRKVAIEFALIIGIGFLVANTFDIAINPNIPHPMPYGLLVGSYHLICILVSCLIMLAMRKK